MQSYQLYIMAPRAAAMTHHCGGQVHVDGGLSSVERLGGSCRGGEGTCRLAAGLLCLHGPSGHEVGNTLHRGRHFSGLLVWTRMKLQQSNLVTGSEPSFAETLALAQEMRPHKASSMHA